MRTYWMPAAALFALTLHEGCAMSPATDTTELTQPEDWDEDELDAEEVAPPERPEDVEDEDEDEDANEEPEPSREPRDAGLPSDASHEPIADGVAGPSDAGAPRDAGTSPTSALEQSLGALLAELSKLLNLPDLSTVLGDGGLPPLSDLLGDGGLRK